MCLTDQHLASTINGMPSFNRMESPGHVIHLVARLLQRSLWNRVTAHGVAPAQLSILLALYEADRPTQADLVEQVKIDQSTMAKTLSRMERDELIARRPDPDDGRRSRILLTRQARRLERAPGRQGGGLSLTGRF